MSTTPEAAAPAKSLHSEFSAADTKDMLEDLERLDETHVSFSEEEVLEQVVSHQQADETAAVCEATTLQEILATQHREDSHTTHPPILVLDDTNDESVRAEAAITPIPHLTASDVLPAQAEATAASSQTQTPSNEILATSTQPDQRFEDYRAIRPGGLLTSKYADASVATVAPPLGSTLSTSAYAANRNSAKRQLVEDENEEPAGYIDERSAKRMRSTHSREPTENRSTPIRRSYPSPWNRYAWALIKDNVKDRIDHTMDSHRKKTVARSIVNPNTVDKEPVIKQEPDEFSMNPPASLHPVPLTPAQSISPGIRQPRTGPSTARPTTSQAQIKAAEHVDLFYLCIPRTGHNQTLFPMSEDDRNLLGDLQRKARRILNGEKDRVDIRSRIPVWMRNGLSEEQKEGIAKIQKKINAMQAKIKASQKGNKGRHKKGKGANATSVGPKPAPMKYTSATVMQNHQRTSLTVAPTPIQTQPLTPQHALPPFGLEHLDYDNLYGPALVYSALEQVNNMLKMFKATIQCSLSGLDLINLQKSDERVQPRPPPGYVTLSLDNQPYSKLAGPSLANHTLQEINEMMRSFGLPQQFALCWKDLQQTQ